MPDTKAFIQSFAAAGRAFLPELYYDEGPRSDPLSPDWNSPLPYSVISSIRFTEPDESGMTAFIDIDHWHSDESDHAVELEERCDTLRRMLDDYIISIPQLSAIIRYESQDTINDPEIELMRRQQTYMARIFFKED